MVTMACTFLGSTSIPLAKTMYPRSLLDLTPKAHFFGFSLTLNASKMVKRFFSSMGFGEDIMYIVFHKDVHHIMKDSGHGPLIGGPNVL